MKDSYKIVYIGAGSFRFTVPCTLNILDFATDFHPIELWLVDIDAESLALMTYLVKLLVRYHKKDITVHATTDRREALPNADYVLISISVGMQKAEWFDIHIPLKYGIPQNTGDTVGPGGIFRGVRTIPTIVAMIKDIEELCPDATILNYTNPQGTIVLSALQAAPKIQSIGLCHEFFYVGTKKFGKFLDYAGVDMWAENKFRIIYGGVNHFSWMTDVKYGGEDIYPKMRDAARYGYESGDFHRPFNYYLLDQYDYFNYVEDRHVAEFIPKYYNYFNYQDEPFGIKLRNVYHIHMQRTNVYKVIRWAIKRRNHWFLKLFTRPMEGGEKALMMAKDKERNYPRHHVCNVLNKGRIPNLPNNCIIEVPCYFQDHLIQTPDIGPLPKEINKWVKVHALNQQLVVDAAISGKKEDLLKALLADPMCQFIEDNDKIEEMMESMLFYERKWLRKFSESIPSQRDIENLKHPVVKSDLGSYQNAIKTKFAPESSLKQEAWPQVK